MRKRFDPGELGARSFYKLTTSLLIPRPIAWVSTRSEDGVDNLAPHSFFTCSCTDPPVLQFTSVGVKDTLRNCDATGEFVISLASEPMLEEVNRTATDFPAEQSEFERVGVEAEESECVGPPRVAEAPASFECRVIDQVSFGNSTVVFGEVLLAVVDEGVLGEDGLARPDAVAPLSRLGRNQWSSLGEVVALDRIRYSDWPGD